MSEKSVFFSIVIPTLNEEKFLPKLLTDLSTQTFTNFEVIHVDGSSDDKTVEESKKFTSKFQLTVKVIKERNVSKQRNTGLDLAIGQWVVFMDADDRIRKDFLLKLAQSIEKNDGQVFTCYLDDQNVQIADRSIITLSNLWLKFSSKIKPFAPGSLIGIKRSLSTGIRFDEKLYLAEDSEFVQDAVKKGLQFTVFDEPKYEYSLRRLKKEGSLKMFRVYSKGLIDFLLTGQKATEPLEDYPMNGGSYYDSVPKISISKIQQLIESSSKAQLEKVKNLIKKFPEF